MDLYGYCPECHSHTSDPGDQTLCDRCKDSAEKETPIIGGYTSYLRYGSEPCIVNARECDIQIMELLDVSRLNPLYILEKIKYYIFKRK
jgi:hypothetical protein